MKLRVAFLLALVCITAIVFSCRRNNPSLVDANRPPETELWYAPADSTEYSWSVHMFWRGVDFDGVVERYIWTIQDTLTIGELAWNPAERVADLRTGRTTTRTDSIFSFTAFQDVGGVPLQKNRQAFYIAAIDDNGVIDPQPAGIEFVATVGRLPQLAFKTLVDRYRDGMIVARDTLRDYDPDTPPDTVGMFRPFSISFEGITENGLLRAYAYRPLVVGVNVPGSFEWYPAPTATLSSALDSSLTASGVTISTQEQFYNDDIIQVGNEYMLVTDISGNTLTVTRGYGNLGYQSHPAGSPVTRQGRFFANAQPDTLPSGPFRFAAQARDDAGAESRIDPVNFSSGVVELVVNFEPDTWFTGIENRFTDQNGVAREDTINFRDSEPDTIPFRSWITLLYDAQDSPFDSSLCVDVDPDNLCLRYQIKYARERAAVPGSFAQTGWLPVIPEDSNEFGTPDSTSMNIGSVEYDIQVRSVDEYDKADGTPPTVELIGNFDPTLDTYELVNWDGTVINDGDTLRWEWMNAENGTDTINFDIGAFVKRYSFYIRGTGHDSPKELPGSGVKSWLYQFTRADDPSISQRFARAETWADGQFTNSLADTFSWLAIYDFSDPQGNGVWAALPSWLNQTWDYSLLGRDTGNTEQFEQLIVLDAKKTTINEYNTSGVGRWTAIGNTRFYFEIVR